MSAANIVGEDEGKPRESRLMVNVVLIMADQMRYDALGCLGNSVVSTPALDAIGRRGACLLRHVTPNQMCSPSRATIFSGLYPRHHKLHRNGVVLDPQVDLVTHELLRTGYRTHAVGKVHFQPCAAEAKYRLPESWSFWASEASRNWRGPYYGFETAEFVIGESAYCMSGGHYAQWLRETHPDVVDLYDPAHALERAPADLDEVWKSGVPAELHYNTWIADRSIDFISSVRTGDPFFLFVSFPDPHHPFSPPAPYCHRHDPRLVPLPRIVPGELDRMPPYLRDQVLLPDGAAVANPSATYLECVLGSLEPREQGYIATTDKISEDSLRLAIAHTYGAVEMIDHSVGRILDCLESRGLTEDTLVIFTSDHGELLGDHGLLHKGPCPYRQLIQVPMLIAGPGVQRARIRALTSHLDLKATILELVGLEAGRGDGVSLAGLLSGRVDKVRDHTFNEFHPRVVANQYNHSFISEDWRLTLYPNSDEWGELFNLAADPYEQHNLFGRAESGKVISELTSILRGEFPACPEINSVSVADY
jgi:arylsulfatase A-like enzyme